MTMAHQREFEPTLIRGEDFALEPSPIRTEDVIIPGYDIIVEQPVQEKTEQTEEEKAEARAQKAQELLEEAIQSELYTLDGWLLFKVKSELVSQLYTNIGNEAGVNIAHIQEVVNAELQKEKEKNLDQALHVAGIIPYAAMVPTNPLKGPDSYWVKDIDNLQRRVDVHYEVVSFIESIESQGDDGMYSYTEDFVKRTQIEARDEVISILKDKLVSTEAMNEARIEELQDGVIILEAEVEFAKEQRDDNRKSNDNDVDIELYDKELVTHLTSQAKDLAL